MKKVNKYILLSFKITELRIVERSGDPRNDSRSITYKDPRCILIRILPGILAEDPCRDPC
jgi:hypothetical protein